MFYLKFGFYLDARFLLLSAELHGPGEQVICVTGGFVHEHNSRGQPLLPAIPISLDGIADRCSEEGEEWGKE